MLKMVAYWVPKAGTDLSDWEDGAAYSQRSGWFAVADGASTGASSREWAFSLTSAFIRDQPVGVFDESSAGFADWIDQTRRQFNPRASGFRPSKAPAWVQDAGAVMGSHATFLAGRILDQRLDAVAVGDCCLFRHSPGGRTLSFPLTDPSEFGSSPDLVSSQVAGHPTKELRVGRYTARLEADDVVFVASDALAEWLTRNLGEPDVWRLISTIGNAGFHELCRDLRAGRAIKNDDVTLFRACASSNGWGAR